MFSGIGGFELGTERALADGRSSFFEDDRRTQQSASCIGFSEIDKNAIAIYQRHFPGHKNYGDASKIDPATLPDFDFLVGGFPCQAFSVAGKRLGFQDTRGTLFFEIARILSDKRPRHFLLENVKGLLSHDEGKTFATILGVLTDLGYWVEWQVLNSKNFGVPQNRERVFFVGHLGGEPARKVFPLRNDGEEDSAAQFAVPTISTREGQDNGSYLRYPSRDEDERRAGLSEIAVPGVMRTHKDGRGFRPMQDDVSPCVSARAREDGSQRPCVAVPVLTPDRAEKRQNGRRFKENGEEAFTVTAQDQHGVYDGLRIRRLTPVECERLQSFPDDWTKYAADGKQMPDSARYKACGNAVTVNVIEAIVKELFAEEIEINRMLA